MLDCTYRVQVPHRKGLLAQVMAAIADGEGLIGDIVTASTGREHIVREITVELRDHDQAKRIATLVGRIDGVRVLWYQDRAMLRHEGGKLTIEASPPDPHRPGDARRLHARGRARLPGDR